ncbi:GntR family transcriptional regulator [Granulosicoccus antarcticus]|uniref:GntR family transcriptional regulator n=1 Tax=Granulosicoccus antarcticus TaxID=437505 RepID=UPI00197ACB08|nr:GntR family transcriptional regulator [Granulosicoccus antarcticus]
MERVIHIDTEIDSSLPLGPQVYELLKKGIVQAQFKPGDRASEVEISRQLEVSRQPVREAFLRLQAGGLLDIRPQRGTFVQKISVKAVLDARFLREAIESDIVALVAVSRKAAVIAELKKQIKAQRKVAKADPVSFMKLDDLFHRTLAEAAEKSSAWQFIEDLKTQMDRVRFLSFNHFHVEQLIAQHVSIVDAIESGSSTDAVRYIRNHLREILKSLPMISHEHPDYFDPVSDELADTTTIININ